MIKRAALLVFLSVTLACMLGTSKPPKVYELTKVNPKSIKMLDANQLSVFGIVPGMPLDEAVLIIESNEHLSTKADDEIDNLIWVSHTGTSGRFMSIFSDRSTARIIELTLLDNCTSVVKPNIHRVFQFSNGVEQDPEKYAALLLRYLGDSSGALIDVSRVPSFIDPNESDQLDREQHELDSMRSTWTIKVQNYHQHILNFKTERIAIESNQSLNSANRSELLLELRKRLDTQLFKNENPRRPRSIPPGSMGSEATRRMMSGPINAPPPNLETPNANEIRDLLTAHDAGIGRAGLLIEFDQGYRVTLLADSDGNRSSRFTLK